MDQVKIGAFIARLRQEKGWTQEELGARLGVTNKTVSRWETGTYMPGVEMLTLLGRELDVTLNELLEGRRLEGDDFRAAADEKLAAAMLSPRERARQWLARYGVFAAVTLVLCVFLGTMAVLNWQYRQEHPEDVGTEHAAFMYRAGGGRMPWRIIKRYFILVFITESMIFSMPVESIWSGDILHGMGTRSVWMMGRRPAGSSSRESSSAMWTHGMEN